MPPVSSPKRRDHSLPGSRTQMELQRRPNALSVARSSASYPAPLMSGITQQMPRSEYTASGCRPSAHQIRRRNRPAAHSARSSRRGTRPHGSMRREGLRGTCPNSARRRTPPTKRPGANSLGWYAAFEPGGRRGHRREPAAARAPEGQPEESRWIRATDAKKPGKNRGARPSPANMSAATDPGHPRVTPSRHGVGFAPTAWRIRPTSCLRLYPCVDIGRQTGLAVTASSAGGST